MKSKRELFEQVMQEAQKIEIPEGIQPEKISKKLDSHFPIKTGQEDRAAEQKKEGEPEGNGQGEKKEAGKEKKQGRALKVSAQKILALAACLVLLLGGFWLSGRMGSLPGSKTEVSHADSIAAEKAVKEEEASVETAVEREENLSQEQDFGNATYEEIYASMLPAWENEYAYLRSEQSMLDGTVVAEEAAVEDMGGVTNGSMASKGAAVQEVQEEKMSIAFLESEKELVMADDAAGEAYGTTNIQTVGVDEGDIIKNDGRYLYQIVGRTTDNGYQQTIQVVDTKEGLTQVGCIGNFDHIQEFYVRNDRLIVIENKSLDYTADTSASVSDFYDVMHRRNAYHEISFYDISYRENPHFLKRFTLNGEYTSSRISDGYFYGFSRFYADSGAGEEDYEAYIPRVDGEYLTAEQILLPQENTGTCYLVLVSVDLEHPKEFVETKAVVSTGEMYYVSSENIYATSFHSAKEQEGLSSSTTDILRFSYAEGKFSLAAKGTIKGQLESSFSLDEHEGYLRAVTTVQEYRYRRLTDNRTGKDIGYQVLEEKETNSLYVLDEQLKMVGRIEGLAEDERIYSARFFGETGYFVTFRQTDPLYAVDLSDPAKPEILSELKISGFSEYLHLYGTDQLLGIGMEADEETGIQEDMKLSMFDISDPTDVQEEAKLNLENFDYSEALYNHKAVLVNAEANIIGFEAEGYSNRYLRKYLIFSYDAEHDRFIREMELDAKDVEGNFCQTRGTFIGENFYLLCSDGSITSYDRDSGRKLETLQFNVKKR